MPDSEGRYGKYGSVQEVLGTIVGVRKLQDRGRVQIPKEVRDELHLEDGDGVYWIRGSDGRYYISKATSIR